MILQALVRLYDQQFEQGKLEPPGWQEAKAAYALQLSEDGTLRRVIPLAVQSVGGKKEERLLRTVRVPEQVERTSGVAARFLCDDSTYFLGVDEKGKPEGMQTHFAACRELHKRLLGGSDHPAAKAIVRFFEAWQPERARSCEALKDVWKEVFAGGNLVFMVGEQFAHEIPEIRQLWDRAYAEERDGEVMRCLVTGERTTIARLHPKIKGIVGGQPMGTSLVSFNAPAYESFGRDGGQGSNAPVSRRAAFAYGAALNGLLSRREHRVYLGDSTVVFWAEDGQDAPADVFAAMLGNGDEQTAQNLRGILENLAEGRAVDWMGVPLEPTNPFYVLGLSPSVARLSVRFFIHDSLGALAERMQRHYKRLEIVRPKFDAREYLSVWQLLNETVNKKSRDKSASPQMSGDLLRAILTDGLYPATLLNQTEMRIRAEHEVTRGRAAIVKAYLLRNARETSEFEKYREVLCVNLNEHSDYPAYVLGRLFSVLEALQEAANPNINATIRDRYFNAACGTPAVVFPQLIRLAQAHLGKLSEGNRIYFNKQITDLIGRLSEEYPARQNLYDQGIFQIGYYHQTQKRYEKKEDK